MPAPRSFNAAVRILDDGFLRPRAELASDFVGGNRFHHVPVDELPVSVQFVKTTVELAASHSTDHLVLWTHYPRLDDAVLSACASAIARAFPDTPTTFVRDVALTYLAERVDVDTSIQAAHLDAPAEAIAAVSAAHCWGTLADIERVTVHLAGDAYLAQMRSDSVVWRATVRRTTSSAG